MGIYKKTFWGNYKGDSLSPWPIEYRLKPLSLSTSDLFESPEYSDKRLYMGTPPNQATRATNVTLSSSVSAIERNDLYLWLGKIGKALFIT